MEMTKKVLGAAIGVGRAATYTVGLAVVLALVLGVATAGLAAVPGDPLNLGKGNKINKLTSLAGRATGAMLRIDNNGTGPALDLQVEPGKAPLTVNSETRVDGLNADKLDGVSSEGFLAANGKAASAATADNADTLDGKDSGQFASTTSEAWRVVGTSGQPEFGKGLRTTPMWQNFDTSHNSAAFYKDSTGVVHIRGVVSWINNTGNTGTVRMACNHNNAIFTLPQGYRPAKREVLLSVSNDAPIRVTVDAFGGVYPCNETRDWSTGHWISIDGISFRAEN
jgi:hypothetical protein